LCVVLLATYTETLVLVVSIFLDCPQVHSPQLVLNYSLRHIATCLQANNSLRVLNLAGNQLGPDSADALSTALLVSRPRAHRSSCRPTALRVGHVHTLAAMGTWKGAVSRCTCVCFAIPALRSSWLIVGVHALLPLQENQTLEELDLHFNNLGDAGVAKLAEALKVCVDTRMRTLCWTGTHVVLRAI
jgi:hypothetical protein